MDRQKDPVCSPLLGASRPFALGPGSSGLWLQGWEPSSVQQLLALACVACAVTALFPWGWIGTAPGEAQERPNKDRTASHSGLGKDESVSLF